jgi:hypothetical protein
MDTKKLQSMMTKEITRKQFLSYVGAVFLSIIGIKGLLKNLVTNHPSYRPAQPGYGFGDYGNKKH